MAQHSCSVFAAYDASSTAQSASANSTAFLVEEFHELEVLINVTAVSGGGTLTATLQTSDDNSTFYSYPTTGAHGTTIAAITATGQYRQVYTGVGKYARVSLALSGGSSPTFTHVTKLVGKT